jgi:CRP-like cAMP-binding protein
MKDWGSVGNTLLAALPPAEIARLASSIEEITCASGTVLVESYADGRHVYFPTTSIVALLYTTQDGATCGIGVVGNDGIVGISVFLGGEALPGSAVVVVGGRARRVSAAAVRDEFRRGGTFQRLLLRYTQALVDQVSQTAVCQGLHAVEQRLARWILMIQDRSGSRDLALTQDSLAAMLGVRRESVSHAAGHLQSGGSIGYVRGHVRIADRQKLERATCECYHAIRSEFDRLLAPEAIAALSRTGTAGRTGSH